MNRRDRRRLAKQGSPAMPGLQLVSGGAPAGDTGPAFAAGDAVAFLAGHARTAPVPLLTPPTLCVTPPPAPPPVEAAPDKADAADYGYLRTAAYYRALDAARNAAPGERASAMAHAVRTLADEVWASVRAEIDAAGGRIACAAGCASCCHQLVAIAPAEAAAIARHVDRHFTPAQRDGLTARIRALDSVTRGQTAPERARLRQPCAFLENGGCSIYEARPLRCRGVYSRDVGHCHWAMENPDAAIRQRESRPDPTPFVVAPARIMDAALTGLARACRDVGIDAGSLELTAAARIALAVPDLERHLASGEPVFAAAMLADPGPGGSPASAA